MKVQFPDYNNCLTNVSNSILKYFDIKTNHTSLKELDLYLNKKNYENIILILYDGMGSNLLDRNLEKNSFLLKHKIKDINSVFPATTTASTTSVLSGLNPCEHGWLGWDLYFKNEDKTISMFLNTIKDTDDIVCSENIAQKYYSYESIIKLINKKYKAHKLVPFGDNCYEDLDDMNNKIINLTREKGKKFIYAYYDEPDHTMHELGTNHTNSINLFKFINDSTEKLCNNIENSLIIVIADHGHIDSVDITLTNYPEIYNLLKQTTSIEPRACTFFVKDGKNDEFQKKFNEYFSNEFKLYTKEEVICNKLFGDGKTHKHFSDSLGDFLAVAISNKYIRYNEDSVKLESMHAGITVDETIVPLIIIER